MRPFVFGLVALPLGCGHQATHHESPPRPAVPLIEWFVVSHNELAVQMEVSPPGRQPWKDSFPWSTVQRVCFKCEEPEVSDGLYVFTSPRPESYVIPTEARGGRELWFEILRRGLFDSELAIRAAASSE